MWTVASGIAVAGFAPGPDRPNPTFSADIYPIMKAKCLPCHRENTVGPFPLDTYKRVRQNLKLVEIQVLSRNMPPYQIHSDLGQVGCGEPFTDSEMQLFQEWLRSGAAEGTPLSAQPAPIDTPSNSIIFDFKDGPATRAEGAPYWVAEELPIHETIEITGYDFIPKSPGVLRSATLGIVREGGKPPRHDVSRIGLSGNSILGAWSDGMPAFRLPSDTSITLRKGDRLRVLSLYQPNGRAMNGGFTVRFHTVASPLARTIDVITLEDSTFVIEAGGSPTFTLGKTVDKPRQVYAILPEARFYCTTFEATASNSKGQTVLFATNRWNPYWIGNFEIPGHPPFDRQTTLAFSFTYNNDERCAMNQTKPPRDVRAGPTIEDEACAVHILTLVDR